MSWFTDLAGKAESLLEKVDTAAASALTKDQINQEAAGFSKNVFPSEPVISSVSTQKPTTVPVVNQGVDFPKTASESSVLGGPTVPIKPRLPSSGFKTPPRVTRTENKNDDKLFEFLNSNVPTSKERKPIKPKALTVIETSSDAVVRANDTSLLVQQDDADGRINDATAAKNSNEGEKDTNISDRPSLTEPQAQDMPEHEIHHHSQPPADDHVSNLEFENTLLRKEVSSLNEEMVSVVQRAKEAERRVKETEKQLQRSQQQLAASEEISRQLRRKEDDYTEALSAKDSQLAVLRVRIQESDQQLKTRQQQIEQYQLERERLLQDHSASTGVHSHALDTLKAKLEETESKLKAEQESQKKLKQESMERQTKLEEEQAAMAESLKTLQKRVNEEKNKNSESATALKTAKGNLETVRQELKDYKDKAARILQAKDKVIASLRDGSKGEVTSTGVTSSEYDEVCHERDMFKDEVNQVKYKMEQLKADLQDLEQQQQSEADLAREKVEELETALEDEKRKKDACEQQIQQHLQDLHQAQDEIRGTKSSFMCQLQERENESQKLRNQLATKALTSTSEEELGNRVRALTENLIQKQTLIEALSTEKNSLVLQLERLEKQYRDVQASTSKVIAGSSATYDGFDDNDENTLSRVRSISSIMPSQFNGSRKVKRAVNEIDKFSIRLGLFLRRYPIARLFVIIYMVLLHVWVLVVLLTYQPEVHTTASAHLPQPPARS